MMKTMLDCCKIYISESRNILALKAIDQAACKHPEILVINKFTDNAYNRVGYTLVSNTYSASMSPDSRPLKNSVFEIVRVALEEINLDLHHGTHPRLGVIDHICFHPLSQASMTQTSDLAKSVAAEIGNHLEGDCHDSYGRAKRCVSGALYNYSAQLLSTHQLFNSKMKYNLTEALLFLSHYMGDIHQPLHVGFTGDEGGNTILVHWYRRKTNLHHVWDNMIIESALRKFYNSDLAEMIKSIQVNVVNSSTAELPSWQNCASNETACPNPYASESISLACQFAYRNATPGITLGDEYFLSRLPVIKKRLALGGIRLAATLNRIFSSHDKQILSADF